jgi:putative ABC transport system permease protein
MMWINVAHAVRHLRRRPVLTFFGIVSLAVGIGCALACATVVNAVLFRAFPYSEPDRLVFVWENNSKRGVGLTTTSVLNYKDLKSAATTFEELGAFIDVPFTIDGPAGSERALGYQVSAGLIDQTRVAPLLGRLFTAAEDTAAGPNVVVLSHGLWARRFGGDPTIVGRDIRLTGVPHTVIGVMPPGFLLPPIFGARLLGADTVVKEADLWVPLKLEGLPERRDARMLFVLGRLKAKRSIADSQAEASTIARRLATDYAVDDFGLDFTVVALNTQVLSNVRTLLVLLAFVGALVLVIATTNAAHLLLVDSMTMSGETAVRSALGATAWRLAYGQATLGMLWCALATVGAVVIAVAAAVPVAAYTKANVPRLNEVKLDATVGAIALALGLLGTLAISLLPIVQVRRTASTRSASGAAVPVGMSRWRRVFVVVQLAIAIVVLATAAQLFRSADRLAAINPGFVADGVHVFELMPPDSQYGSPSRRVELQRRLLELAGDLPGRRAAATVDYLPFGGETNIVNFTIENHVVVDSSTRPRAALRAVSTSYFDVLSIPLESGRLFDAVAEGEGTVAIVNEAFGRRFLPGENAVGRRIKRGGATSANPWLTIVAVVGSVRAGGLGVDPQPEVFVPFARGGAQSTVNLIVKSSAPASVLARAVVDLIHRVDAELSPSTVTTMSELVASAVGQPYFYARLFGVLAAVAFALSLAGVYSIAALGVSARSNEIAIRSCLGAQPSDIVRLILSETGTAVTAAVVLGAVGAAIVQKRMGAFVYGVGSIDWPVIAVSALTLSVLAMSVVYLAIRRVLVIRPMDLLRYGLA